MFPSQRKMWRHLNVYASERCIMCSAYIGKDPDECPIESRFIPINPEIYVSYLCASCFIDTSVEELVKELRAYLVTEKGHFEEQITKWKLGRSYDPLQFLEHSVKFLKGRRADAPFKCAVFSLHERYIKGHPHIKHHGHLTLISFD